MLSEACQGPLRITPDRGPTTGGTLLTVEGSEFWIGALDWWARIDDVWLHPVYGGLLSSCTLTFYAPPMAEGTYPVHVLYGWPPFESSLPPDTMAGTFTYESYNGAVGHGFCRSSAQCDQSLEVCDLGTGRCVPNLCLSLSCNICDPIEGCLDTSQSCQESSECQLIRSACGCHAVHATDPRPEITSCALGGCESCVQNHCDTEHVKAICVGGRCVERRGDALGVACSHLEAEQLTDQLVTNGWIHSLRATAHGQQAAVVWTEPQGLRYYRNGVIGFALLGSDGTLQNDLVTVDGPGGLDTNPSVASDGSMLGAVWVTEQPEPTLYFQQFDSSGSPVGEPVLVDDRADEWVTPVILGDSNGFDLFWVQEGESSGDGLYHAMLTSTGQVSGSIDHIPWIIPELENFAVTANGDHFVVTWPNSVSEFEGLFWTDIPLSDPPVQWLSDIGVGVDLVSTGQGFGIIWREWIDLSGGSMMVLRFMSFDQDGRALSAAREIHRHAPHFYGQRIVYLGGVFLISWFEQDSWDADQTSRLMAAQVTETGRQIGNVVEVSTLPESSSGLFATRLETTILTGFVEPGASFDSLSFIRWNCIP